MLAVGTIARVPARATVPGREVPRDPHRVHPLTALDSAVDGPAGRGAGRSVQVYAVHRHLASRHGTRDEDQPRRDGKDQ